MILNDIPLAPFTAFGIGGPARWFSEAASEAEIAEAVAWARERSLPLFVLGGGSNLLVSDAGFPGLVLRIAVKGIEQQGERFLCSAGEDWDSFVSLAVERNFAGVECLAGIPGTVGGTPVQNVGAYGQEAGSVIERVRAFHIDSREFVEFSADECRFSYRCSRFNSSDMGKFIVTRVDYRLRPRGGPQLDYADLKSYFLKSHIDRQATPTLSEVAAAVRVIRQSKGMLLVEDDPDCRSAGSFFKNPAVVESVAGKVREYAASHNIPLRIYPTADGLVKIPAAWLIEQAGFPKGYALGAAGISSRHTLALINRGGARAEDILALAKKIADAVAGRFGIHLEMEPVQVGF
jgi:UDP-N-acetylmuramate dehydrogenase